MYGIIIGGIKEGVLTEAGAVIRKFMVATPPSYITSRLVRSGY